MTNQELAALANWAAEEKKDMQDAEGKKACAMIREGADLLLRRRALLNVNDRDKDVRHEPAPS
jgi:hypothetical protein